MLINSVREIKDHFLNHPATLFNVGTAAPKKPFPQSISLGITKQNNKNVLAVRCYGKSGFSRQGKLQRAFLEVIQRFAKNEVEYQFLEMPSAIDPMIENDGEAKNNQKRHRPLRLGVSCGHFRITAGTLGCGAKQGNNLVIVSNAHVLNDCNNGKKGDRVYQPGKHDSGTEKDTVATVLQSVKLKSSHNLVDACIALPSKGIEFDPITVEGHGKWNGFTDGSDLEIGQELMKLGRTTGWTRGKVTGLEMDNVAVGYGSDLGVISFDNQIEVVNDSSPYISPGDSGSVSMSSDFRGVGLNFAGNNVQAYLNDMRQVTKLLKLKSVK